MNINSTVCDFSSLLLFVFLVGEMFLGTSCKKTIDSYKLIVKVTVYDTINVQNALARVFAPVENTFVDYYLYTDEDGKGVVTFDNEVVVEIVARKASFKACAFTEIRSEIQRVKIDLKPPSESSINGCVDDN